MGYGGAELLTLDISNRLAALGNEVHIIVIGYCEAEVINRERSKNLHLHLLKKKLYSPANIIGISRIISTNKFDIIHSHLFPALYLTSLIRAFHSGNEGWIYTEHSTSNGRRKIQWLRRLEKWIYARYDKVVCISKDANASLREWISMPDKTIEICNGIDIEKFQTAIAIQRKALNINPEDCVILMVGAFRSEKNQAGLIRALQYLPETFRLLLAGDGPEIQACISLSKELSLDNRIQFLGSISDVGGLMKAANIYVLPSFFEGFGISALEAAAAGLPVVFSNVKGLKEVFSEFGIPVDPNSEKSIANGILEAERRIANGSSIAPTSAFLDQYNIKVTVDSYVRLYTDLRDRYRKKA